MNPSNPTPAGARRPFDRRNKRRAQITQKLRVRPSEPAQNFDEVLSTINACRDGVYFATERKDYRKDMRLFVSFPYSEAPGAMNMEYIGRVVRIDALPRDRFGIAVQLVMTMNLA
jgi:hypothetical protein